MDRDTFLQAVAVMVPTLSAATLRSMALRELLCNPDKYIQLDRPITGLYGKTYDTEQTIQDASNSAHFSSPYLRRALAVAL